MLHSNVLVLIWMVVVAIGCNHSTPVSEAVSPKSSEAKRRVTDAEIKEFCGACHLVPRADYFPRDAWFTEVKQGYDFYVQSGRQDLHPPPMQEIVSYYRERAPEELAPANPPTQTIRSPVPGQFAMTALELPPAIASPAVSHVLWQPGESAKQPGHLLFCDMQAGEVRQLQFAERGISTNRLLAKVDHPGHVEPCDFDKDGRQDWVVADLGTFQPADHDRGKVIWIRPKDSAEDCEAIVIASGFGRVADVQLGDFNGDQRDDLVVAEFGWRRSGRILVLINTSSQPGNPQFETHVVDTRHGAIHVPVLDLNVDGKLDFVALISQEHEVIEAFLGRGDGTFDKRPIFQGADPAFGSSGIQVVDLDRDGDLDVLYTNGDTLDSHYLKPYHAVHWLENEGGFPFRQHQLTTMPGVMRAVAVDRDRDGDPDIVACAHVPISLLRTQKETQFDSLIWLEQTERGKFVRHPIEKLSNGHMALDVGDFDRDGQVDLAVGCFANDVNSQAPWLTFWWGQNTSPTAPSAVTPE